MITDNEKKQLLTSQFEKWAGEKAIHYIPLPPSGSYREYYRIKGASKTALGVYNSDKKENIAFLEFSKHFHSNDLSVPAIYSEDRDQDIYLEEDLGDTTLFSYLMEEKKDSGFSSELISLYKKVLDELPKFQITAGRSLNYSNCYPRSKFDKQSMMWDLNYFKYYFLKLGKIAFDEQQLETDFHIFTDYLLTADCHYFLYRDFQSRNVMLKDGKPYFIDYQGGRQGAVYYDLASLLYDAKADIPQEIRNELAGYYISVLQQYIPVDQSAFMQMYHAYVYIRIMQAMGAYGFRGFYEKKEHFLKSIPFAIENLAWLLGNVQLPIHIPSLVDVWQKIINSSALRKYGAAPQYMLEVSINSFSYKHGVPSDPFGNGGGFVFDCRGLHNPGRYPEYKVLTGRDESVKQFLLTNSNVEEFLERVYSVITMSIDAYSERKFEHLMINFGCTGGQHRSVFCADRLAEMLRSRGNVKISVRHREIENI